MSDLTCLGLVTVPSKKFDREAAELYAFGVFRDDFKSRYPGGEVISDYEYLGRRAFAGHEPGGMLTPGKLGVDRVLRALAMDYRRWNKPGDYRKSDGMGISPAGDLGELLECTTERNRASAIKQMRDKLDTLRHTVNRIHGLHTEWRGTHGRPGLGGRPMCFPSVPQRGERIRYICFQPTQENDVPAGVALYHVHAVPDVKRRPVPMRAPDPIAVPETAPSVRRAPVRPSSSWIEVRAREFIAENPDTVEWIRRAGVFAAASALALMLVTLISPVPGDEVAGLVAAAVVAIVLRGGGAPSDQDEGA